jgi:hypothetical protein
MPLLFVVNTVTGAIIDSQLRDAFTYWLDVHPTLSPSPPPALLI